MACATARAYSVSIPRSTAALLDPAQGLWFTSCWVSAARYGWVTRSSMSRAPGDDSGAVERELCMARAVDRWWSALEVMLETNSTTTATITPAGSPRCLMPRQTAPRSSSPTETTLTSTNMAAESSRGSRGEWSTFGGLTYRTPYLPSVERSIRQPRAPSQRERKWCIGVRCASRCQAKQQPPSWSWSGTISRPRTSEQPAWYVSDDPVGLSGQAFRGLWSAPGHRPRKRLRSCLAKVGRGDG